MSMSMVKTKSAAQNLAKQRKGFYGMSVHNGQWYFADTVQKLSAIGCVHIDDWTQLYSKLDAKNAS